MAINRYVYRYTHLSDSDDCERGEPGFKSGLARSPFRFSHFCHRMFSTLVGIASQAYSLLGTLP